MGISNNALDNILSAVLVVGVIVVIMFYLDYRKHKDDEDTFPY